MADNLEAFGMTETQVRSESMVDRVAEAIMKVDAEEKISDYYKWARAAIEAMRMVPEVCYDDYRCDKTWRELNSTEVWNLWIDAALKETK